MAVPGLRAMVRASGRFVVNCNVEGDHPRRELPAPRPTPASAMRFSDLVAAYGLSQPRVELGLQALAPERLRDPAPFSPLNRPDEALGSLLAGPAFHEAYHSGQTGVLRRGLGRPVAIQ